MDIKALEIIIDLHTSINDRSFTEKDVIAFLIMIREHLQATSPLREICHFIAHRKRYRGNTLNYLVTLSEYMDSGNHLPNNPLLRTGLYNPNELAKEFSSN